MVVYYQGLVARTFAWRTTVGLLFISSGAHLFAWSIFLIDESGVGHLTFLGTVLIGRLRCD